MAFALLIEAAACHRSRQYETQVEVSRIVAVHEDGADPTLDLTVTFIECPGAHVDVRGGADFVGCAQKFKVGDALPVTIEHEWAQEGGHYTWVVRRVGDCTRSPRLAADDDASYALVRECHDAIVDGTRVGFRCGYIPDLVDRCPWFKWR